MDENGISVLCSISGCATRVHGDVRCKKHGGDPIYQWTPSAWGPDEENIEAMRPELLITHPSQKGATS